MMNEQTAIGIDLGGTQIKGVLVNASGEIVKSLVLDTHTQDGKTDAHWKNSIAGMVQQLNPSNFIQCPIGLAAPGLSNNNNSAIAHMPGRLKGLENFNWETLFKQENVTVINDAHAALIAESKAGAATGIQNVLMVTLGTGVGGAILIDGKLHQGFLQRAGHAGHMCLNTTGSLGILDIPGTLEEAFGNASVSKRTNGRFNSCLAMMKGYTGGDTLASFFWLTAVQQLALGLASLINIVSPELIILGGGITKAKNALLDPLNVFMELYEWRPGGNQTMIRLSAFNEYSGAVGAALYSLTYKQKNIAV